MRWRGLSKIAIPTLWRLAENSFTFTRAFVLPVLLVSAPAYATCDSISQEISKLLDARLASVESYAKATDEKLVSTLKPIYPHIPILSETDRMALSEISNSAKTDEERVKRYLDVYVRARRRHLPANVQKRLDEIYSQGIRSGNHRIIKAYCNPRTPDEVVILMPQKLRSTLLFPVLTAHELEHTIQHELVKSSLPAHEWERFLKHLIYGPKFRFYAETRAIGAELEFLSALPQSERLHLRSQMIEMGYEPNYWVLRALEFPDHARASLKQQRLLRGYSFKALVEYVEYTHRTKEIDLIETADGRLTQEEFNQKLRELEAKQFEEELNELRSQQSE
jgi:hypothetical protein